MFKAGVKVSIVSNGYEFNFDKRRDCGMMVPQHGGWPAKYVHLKKPSTTQFLIELDGIDVAKAIRVDLSTRLDAGILLFLRQLQTIIVRDGSTERRLSRFHAVKYGLPSLSLRETVTKSATETTHDYVMFSKQIAVTSMAGDRKYHYKVNNSTSEVAIAIPCAAFSQHRDPSIYDAFCCLPIRHSGLPFPIQAQFRLTASREDLDMSPDMARRNHELLDGIASLFVEAIATFVEIPDLRHAWLSLLPVKRSDKSFHRLVQHIKAKTRLEPLFLGEDENEKLLANKVIFVPEKYRFSDQCLLPSIDQNEHNLSARYKSTKDIRAWLGIDALTKEGFISNLRDLISHKSGDVFQAQSAEWHEELARVLLDYPNNELQKLRIVPLTNGEWCRPGPRVFFPPAKKLNKSSEVLLQSFRDIHFVAASAQAGNRHAILTRLKIVPVDDSTICKEISSLHGKDTCTITDPRIFRAHAKYLYEHQYLDRSNAKMDLWTFTQGRRLARSGTLYFDDPRKPGLASQMIPENMQSARMLHESYRSLVSGDRLSDFQDWLQSKLSISSQVPIVKDQQISLEFMEATMHVSSKVWLPVLIEGWDQVSGATSEDVDELSILSGRRYHREQYSIKDIEVDTRCGGKARLCDAYLPTPDLLKLDDSGVVFLAVDDLDKQEWSRWEVLGTLGVVCSARHVHVQLKSLRTLKKQGTHNVKDVSRVYEILQEVLGVPNTASGYLDDVQTCLREEALIWDADSGTWRKTEDCVWSSDFELAFKTVLSGSYATCSTFFQKFLEIDVASMATVLVDISARPVPLADSDVPHMIQLLLDLSQYISRCGSALTVAALRELRDTRSPALLAPLIPVRSADTTIQFRGFADTSFYMVCDRKIWENTFSAYNTVPCTALQGLELVVLFDVLGTAFPSKMKTPRMMSKLIMEEFCIPQGSTLDVSMTQELRQKMSMIKRVVEASSLYLTSDQKIRLATIDSIELLLASSMTVIPYLVCPTTTRRLSGTSRNGGQYLSPGPYIEGQLKLFAEPSRVMKGAAFINELHKDLIHWLSISNARTVDQIREVLVSDDCDQAFEDLTLAGINMNGPPVGAVSSSDKSSAATDDAMSPAGEPETIPASPAPPVSTPKLEVQLNLSQDLETETGIKGEYLIARKLAKMFNVPLAQQNEFLTEIWTSELRHLALPSLSEWSPSKKSTNADFKVKDEHGLLKGLFEKHGNMRTDAKAWPPGLIFHIEVKATAGNFDNGFHMSQLQMDLAKDISNNRDDQEVYVIFRVSDIGRRNGKPVVRYYVDPWCMFCEGELDPRAPEGYTVYLA